MKYYTVNLYDVKYEYPYRGQTILATTESVIVEKKLFSVKELLTGQKIAVLPKKALDKFGVVEPSYQDRDEYEKTGYHLVVLEEELVEKNLTTSEEIDSYVDMYEYSEYRTIYETIKEKTSVSNPKKIPIKEKAKRVRNTKK